MSVLPPTARAKYFGAFQGVAHEFRPKPKVAERRVSGFLRRGSQSAVFWRRRSRVPGWLEFAELFFFWGGFGHL